MFNSESTLAGLVGNTTAMWFPIFDRDKIFLEIAKPKLEDYDGDDHDTNYKEVVDSTLLRLS